ncbi:MAG TPA: hypothetical protein VL281_09485 [Mycobacteriales bacterium]|nr:hypothetical protein [Mycobacteriales bacterium]
MVLHPVGPLPASTYWRRRLVLLVGIVVLVLLLRSCVGGGAKPVSHGSTPTPTPTASASSHPSPTATPTRAAGPLACPDTSLTLTAVPGTPTAPAGSTVRFTLTVRNTGSVACRRDLGGGALEVLVYSGTDRIWSSDDCSTDKGRSVQTLAAGGSLESTVSWAGKRSAAGCPKDEPVARRGTYTVRARLGTLRSGRSVFRLTGPTGSST